MQRREFLKKFTLLSTAIWAPSFLVRTLRAAQASGMTLAEQGNPNRILVVIELAGGCDGFNTVVPYTNDVYYSRRPSLAIAAAQVLKLDGSLGLHPAMTGIKELFDAGQLAIVNGVGYPNPNRSHFRSRDIWHTAEPEKIGRDGWLAKYFDAHPEKGAFQGVNVGGRVPRAMISAEGSSPSIQSIDTYKLETDARYPGDAGNKNATFQEIIGQVQSPYPLHDYVTQTVLDATVSSVQLLEGRSNYQSSVEYPQTPFGNNLRTIAQIIAADLGVTVFYASLGGFDTHASQVVSGNSLQGVHAGLLDNFSSAVKAFLDDMTGMGKAEDVLIMTFSEFGRRVAENGSLGTDHGTANQMFIFGSRVSPGLYGQQPGLSEQELDPVGDMIHTVDFRAVYATVLSRWLGADAESILGGGWPDLGFV